MSSKFSNKKIIVDTGPLIAFAHLNGFGLLNRLFDKVYITEQVFAESQSDPGRLDAITIADKVLQNQLIKTKCKAWHSHERPASLGLGEFSSIILARELGCLVLLDDKFARRAAREYAIDVVGTAGILVHAKQKKMISSVTEALCKLSQKQYYFSDELIQKIKQLANE